MKKFRTIEISNPKFSPQGLEFITAKSENLKGRGDIIVSKSLTAQKDMPVIIFLHGVYGSAWSWPLSGGVHQTMRKLEKEKKIPGFISVFPSDGLWGDGSGYVPHDGYDFEKWIAEDIPELVLQKVKGVTAYSNFFITGLSMGGFGAFKIGAKYHQRFTAFSGHSSITHLQQMKLFTEEPLKHYLQKDKKENDVFETIAANKNFIRSFRFDCGTNDPLYKANKKLHNQLCKGGIVHVFNEFPGGHEWTYWEKHVKDSILFFAKQLH